MTSQAETDALSPGEVTGAGEQASCWPYAHGAAYAARVHVPISWPEGNRCLNDGGAWPCPAYQWAQRVLLDAGWQQFQIKSLDRRTGPWS